MGSNDPIGRSSVSRSTTGRSGSILAAMNSVKQIAVVAAFLIAIAAMFWAFGRLRNGDSEASEASTTESSGATGAASPVADYLLFIDAVGGVDDQTLIVEGLRKLAGAVGYLNLGTLDVQVRLRVAAEHILLNPGSTSTTEAVRNALISAAEAIEMGGNSDEDLRRLAASLQLDRPVTKQQETMVTFFRKAAAALKRTADA